MINIYQKTNLFDPDDILISWNFEGEKKLRFEFKIRRDQSKIAVEKIKRIALCTYVQELFTGRKNNFQYYNGEVITAKLDAIRILDDTIPCLGQYTDLTALATRIKLRVIPHLENLRPGKKSRIVHYGIKLDILNTYVDNILNIKPLPQYQNPVLPINYP